VEVKIRKMPSVATVLNVSIKSMNIDSYHFTYAFRFCC